MNVQLLPYVRDPNVAFPDSSVASSGGPSRTVLPPLPSGRPVPKQPDMLQLLPFVRNAQAIFEERKLHRIAFLETFRTRAQQLLSQIEGNDDLLSKQCKAALHCLLERCQEKMEKNRTSRPSFLLLPRREKDPLILNENSLIDEELYLLLSRLDEEESAVHLLLELRSCVLMGSGPLPCVVESLANWACFFQPLIQKNICHPEQYSQEFQELFFASQLYLQHKGYFEEFRLLVSLLSEETVSPPCEIPLQFPPSLIDQVQREAKGTRSSLSCLLQNMKKLALSSHVQKIIKEDRKHLIEWFEKNPRLNFSCRSVNPETPICFRLIYAELGLQYIFLDPQASECVHRVNHVLLRFGRLLQKITSLLPSHTSADYVLRHFDWIAKLQQETRAILHSASVRGDRHTINQSLVALSEKLSHEEKATSCLEKFAEIAVRTGASLPCSLKRLDQWVSFFTKARGFIGDSSTRSQKAFATFSMRVHEIEEENESFFMNVVKWFQSTTFHARVFRTFGFVPLLDELSLASQKNFWDVVQSSLEFYMRVPNWDTCSLSDFIDHLEPLPLLEGEKFFDDTLRLLRAQKELVSKKIEAVKLQFQPYLVKEKQKFLQDVEQLGLKTRTKTRGEIRVDDFENESQCLQLVALLNVFASLSSSPTPFRALAKRYEEERDPLKQKWQITCLLAHSINRITKRGLAQTIMLQNFVFLGSRTLYPGYVVDELRPSVSLSSQLRPISKRVVLIFASDAKRELLSQERTGVSMSEIFRRVAGSSIQVCKGVEHCRQNYFGNVEKVAVVRMDLNPIFDLDQYLLSYSDETHLKTRMKFGLSIAQALENIHRAGFTLDNVTSQNIFVVAGEQGAPSVRLTNFYQTKKIGEPTWLDAPCVSPEKFDCCATGNPFFATVQSEIFSFAFLLARLKWNRALAVDFKVRTHLLPLVEEGKPISRGAVWFAQDVQNVRERFQALFREVVRISEEPNRDEVDRLLVRMFSLNPAQRPNDHDVSSCLEQWLASH